MIDDKNPHSTYEHAFSISHFKNGVACGVNDDWDVATFCYFNHYGGRVDVTNKVQYDRMIAFGKAVYDMGKYHAKQEIRKVLGVKD